MLPMQSIWAPVARILFRSRVWSQTPRRESLWWIGDTGVRFGIDVAGQGNSTQQALGLKDTTPTRAPWTVIRWLPAGPLLSEQAARVERDTVINIPGQRLQSEGN